MHSAYPSKCARCGSPLEMSKMANLWSPGAPPVESLCYRCTRKKERLRAMRTIIAEKHTATDLERRAVEAEQELSLFKQTSSCGHSKAALDSAGVCIMCSVKEIGEDLKAEKAKLLEDKRIGTCAKDCQSVARLHKVIDRIRSADARPAPGTASFDSSLGVECARLAEHFGIDPELLAKVLNYYFLKDVGKGKAQVTNLVGGGW